MKNLVDTEVSGEEMWRRFIDGDEIAFEQIVALYENDLFTFLNNIVRDYHEAKHLVIEAFARLAAANRQFAERSSVKTYLFAIGKNLAFRYLKMRGREQHISFEDVIVSDNAETPQQYIERKENKELLRKSMLALKEEYRIVLELLYFEDMSYLEAGRIMCKSERQIKNLAYRAKKSLKERLQNQDYSDRVL